MVLQTFWVALLTASAFTVFLRFTRCVRGVWLTLGGYALYFLFFRYLFFRYGPRLLLPVDWPLKMFVQSFFIVIFVPWFALALVLSKGLLFKRIFALLTAVCYASVTVIVGHLVMNRVPSSVAAGVLVFLLILAYTNFVLFYVFPSIDRMPAETHWGVLNVAALLAFLFVHLSGIWPVWVVDGTWTDAVRFLFVAAVAVGIFPFGIWYGRVIRREFVARLVENNTRALAAEVSSMRSDIESARRVRHDMRHHLKEICTFLEAGNAVAALRYVRELTAGDVLEGPALQHWCENAEINSVFAFAQAMAIRKGCAFSAEVQGSGAMPLRSVDFVALMGNLLENAIASTTNGVRARIELDRGALRAEVVNTVPAGFALVDGIPCECAGVGIASVQAVVEKYEGIFAYELAGDELFARVYIGKKEPACA